MGKRWALTKQMGFGLLEVMISMAVVLIVAVGVANYITSTKTINMKIEGATVCRGIVEDVLRQFSNNSNSVVLNSFSRAATGLPANRLETSYTTKDTLTLQYGNFQNIDNDVTKAIQFYNANPTFCSANGGLGLPIAQWMVKDTATFTRASTAPTTTYINLTPVNTATNPPTTFCGTAAEISPLSSVNPNNARSMKLTVTTQTPDATLNGALQRCVGEVYLSYVGDNTPPVFVTPPVVTFDPVAHTFQASLTSNEPGSLFECSTDGGATASICQGSLGSVTMTPTMTGAASNGGTAVSITGAMACPINPPLSFTFRVVDTASNVSAWSTPVSVGCLPVICVGGSSQACTDAGGHCNGTQTCSADGTAWGPCGTYTTVNSVGWTTPGGICTAPAPCVPGATQACSDPTGNCSGGTQTCDPTGTSFGPCSGYTTAINGYTVPGGVCTAGCTASVQTIACIDPSGNCTGGTQTCNATGTGYDPCGGYTAATNGYTVPGGVCTPPSCTPNVQTQACTDPTANCTGGTQTCNAAGTGYGPCGGYTAAINGYTIPGGVCTPPTGGGCTWTYLSENRPLKDKSVNEILFALKKLYDNSEPLIPKAYACPAPAFCAGESTEGDSCTAAQAGLVKNRIQSPCGCACGPCYGTVKCTCAAPPPSSCNWVKTTLAGHVPASNPECGVTAGYDFPTDLGSCSAGNSGAVKSCAYAPGAGASPIDKYTCSCGGSPPVACEDTTYIGTKILPSGDCVITGSNNGYSSLAACNATITPCPTCGCVTMTYARDNLSCPGIGTCL